MSDSMNSGYHGWAMSNRAVEAYENHEMPKSKWTKRAMVAEVEAFCDDNFLKVPENLRGSKKDELFEQFFAPSSWHHTSKLCNETIFYALDELALRECADPMTAQEVEAYQAAKSEAIEAAQRTKSEAAAKVEAQRKSYEDAHRGLGELEITNASKLMAVYPELFGESNPSKSGKSEIVETEIGGAEVFVIVDASGARFSKWVHRKVVEEAIERMEHGN